MEKEVENNKMEEVDVISEKYAPLRGEEMGWIRFGWNIDFVSEHSSDVNDLIGISTLFPSGRRASLPHLRLHSRCIRFLHPMVG